MRNPGVGRSERSDMAMPTIPGRASSWAAMLIVSSMSLALAQTGGSSGGASGGAAGGTAGGAGSGGTAGGAGSGGTAGGAGTGGTSAGTGAAGSPPPAPESRVPSGTGPTPAPTPGQSFSFPSNVGTPGTNDPSGNRVPSGRGPTPAPTPGQSTQTPSTSGRPSADQPSGSARDTTGVAGSRPGCKPATTGSATAEVRAPRIANDPALGRGPSAELNVDGTRSADTGVGGNTSLPRSSSGKENDC
jgi:hypothetical protein